MLEKHLADPKKDCDSDLMDEVAVTIQDVAFGGSGVGRLPDGKIVFVPYTLKDETVRVRLNKSKGRFAEAELVEVISPSPYRTTPPCIYFGKCGGCQYQHATYEEQLRIKEKQVRDTLERIGGFKELPKMDVEAAPDPFGYRNKISVHRGELGEIGFFTNDHRTIIDIQRCLISNENVNQQLETLQKASFKPRHISITDQSQRASSPEGSFHQVNTAMASKLLNWLRSCVKINHSDQLLDLYSGAGFFTLGLADCFATIRGVDYDSHAIHSAILRAKALKISHAQFFAADIEEQIQWLLKDSHSEKTTILMDPPREGVSQKVIQSIQEKSWASLIYISCNPSTLARDLKRFIDLDPSKYLLRSLAIFDMFPQTAHIETVAALELKATM